MAIKAPNSRNGTKLDAPLETLQRAFRMRKSQFFGKKVL